MNTDSSLTAVLPEADSFANADEETLIEDPRAAVGPAQRVEQKLVAALQSNPVLVSQMQGVKRPHDR